MGPDRFRPVPEKARRVRSRFGALASVGAVAVLAVSGAFISRGANANGGPDFCPDNAPINTQPVPKDPTARFEGSPPPGCESWEQYLQQQNNQDIIEGEGSITHIQVGKPDGK